MHLAKRVRPFGSEQNQREFFDIIHAHSVRVQNVQMFYCNMRKIAENIGDSFKTSVLALIIDFQIK